MKMALGREWRGRRVLCRLMWGGPEEAVARVVGRTVRRAARARSFMASDAGLEMGSE